MSASIYPPRKVNVGETERKISVIGGSALLTWALLRGKRLRLPAMLSGAYMIMRGVTGWCAIYSLLGIERTGMKGQAGVRVEHAMTINQRREDVYNYWRNFENLPLFMKHLEDVRVIDGTRSHWVARAPLGLKAEWDAEIIEDKPNEKISWQSLPGSRIPNAGSVMFLDAPGGRGTEVKVTIQYDPPGGSAGAAIARIWGEEPSQQVYDDLRRFKQILETGQVVSTEGQPSGRSKRMEGPGPYNQGMGLRTGEATGHETEAVRGRGGNGQGRRGAEMWPGPFGE